jgi:transcriptional regulator with XRE-family HTH domain
MVGPWGLEPQTSTVSMRGHQVLTTTYKAVGDCRVLDLLIYFVVFNEQRLRTLFMCPTSFYESMRSIPLTITNIVIYFGSMETMLAKTLKLVRSERNWTETEAAERLGVSQSYLAMLERGQRRVTPRLAHKFKSVYGLRPTVLPTPDEFKPRVSVANEEFVNEFSALGYPGFAYLKARVRERNPAETLVEALSQTSLEPRVVEALPWLLLTYWDMNLEWLVREAKLNNLQNRLGFVESLVEEVSKRSGSKDEERTRALSALRSMVETSRLAREDTFLKPVNTEVEREWLRDNRSDQARHWNLLTSWRPEHLAYES